MVVSSVRSRRNRPVARGWSPGGRHARRRRRSIANRASRSRIGPGLNNSIHSSFDEAAVPGQATSLIITAIGPKGVGSGPTVRVAVGVCVEVAVGDSAGVRLGLIGSGVGVGVEDASTVGVKVSTLVGGTAVGVGDAIAMSSVEVAVGRGVRRSTSVGEGTSDGTAVSVAVGSSPAGEYVSDRIRSSVAVGSAAAGEYVSDRIRSSVAVGSASAGECVSDRKGLSVAGRSASAGAAVTGGIGSSKAGPEAGKKSSGTRSPAARSPPAGRENRTAWVMTIPP